MRIAIFGSSKNNITPEAIELTKIIGKEIALAGHPIVTGACLGIPDEGARAAKEAGGKIVGYSPVYNIDEHIRTGEPHKYFDKLKFLDLRSRMYIKSQIKDIYYPEWKRNKEERIGYKEEKERILKENMRDMNLVNKIDAGIIVTGGLGTNFEYSYMLIHQKIIGIALGTGGVADSAHHINTYIKNGEAKNHIFYCKPRTEPGWITEKYYHIVCSPKELIKAIEERYINNQFSQR